MCKTAQSLTEEQHLPFCYMDLQKIIVLMFRFCMYSPSLSRFDLPSLLLVSVQYILPCILLNCLFPKYSFTFVIIVIFSIL